MDTSPQRLFDLFLTHIVVNTVLSGHEGRLAALKVAAKLGNSGQADALRIAESRAMLALARKWEEAVYAGTPILSRAPKQPSSPASAGVWRVFSQIGAELHGYATSLEPYCREHTPARGRAAAKSLVAALVRLTHARLRYAGGVVHFDRVFGSWYPEGLRRYSPDRATSEVQDLESFIRALQSREVLSGGFHRGLRQKVLGLPTAFRIQVHDMNVIVGMACGGLRFSMTYIDRGEAAHWKDIGVSAETAGYWHACGVAPEETVRWVAADLGQPQRASLWRTRGFSPEEAAGWHARNFDAPMAMRWRDHGFHDPAEARAWHDNGFDDLFCAMQWRRRGFQPHEARSWSVYFSVEEARQWRASGFGNPLAARDRKRTMNLLFEAGVTGRIRKATAPSAMPQPSTRPRQLAPSDAAHEHAPTPSDRHPVPTDRHMRPPRHTQDFVPAVDRGVVTDVRSERAVRERERKPE